MRSLPYTNNSSQYHSLNEAVRHMLLRGTIPTLALKNAEVKAFTCYLRDAMLQLACTDLQAAASMSGTSSIWQ